MLTHWSWVMHKCISKLTTIGSDNGLSPGLHQTVIWTNDIILLIGPIGTIFSEILIENHIFSLKKMQLKMMSGKWQPFSLNRNVFMPMVTLLYDTNIPEGVHIKLKYLIPSLPCQVSFELFHLQWKWNKSMTLCKTAVTPMHQQWSYCRLALSHQNTVQLTLFTPLALSKTH